MDIQTLKHSRTTQSKNIFAALKLYALARNYNQNTTTEFKIKNSLAIAGLPPDYAATTPINPKIHKNLTNKMINFCVQSVDKIRNEQRPFGTKTNMPRAMAGFKYSRAITLIYDCVPIEHLAAIHSAENLIIALKNAFKAQPSAQMVGMIEFEVVSQDHLADEVKKTCINQIKNFNGLTENKIILVHLHGVIVGTDYQLAHSRTRLKEIKKFNVAPRQIQIKKFTATWGNKVKSFNDNLNDWCNYATKGAQDIKKGMLNLNYKNSFNPIKDDQKSILTHSTDNLYLESQDYEDSSSLNPHEVIEIIKTIKILMADDRLLVTKATKIKIKPVMNKKHRAQDAIFMTPPTQYKQHSFYLN
jgi:hypothetical protein